MPWYNPAPMKKDLEGRFRKRKTDIGRRLRQIRESRGLSQAKLADMIGCSHTHISLLETGRGSYSLKVFANACEALDADPSIIWADVPSDRLQPLYETFQRLISGFGEEAIDFLTKLEPDELETVCARALEAIGYMRASAGEQPPKVARKPKSRPRPRH